MQKALARVVRCSVVWSLALAACGGSGGGGRNGVGPCETDPPDPTCGMQCGTDADCGAGFYCNADGMCTADCTPDGTGCTDSEICDDHGHCVPEGDGCPAVTVDLTPVIPIVVLLIDQSGSMNECIEGGNPPCNNGAPDRWDSVKNALTDATNGVLTKLDQQIEVGATLYTSENGTQDGGTCPELTSIAPAIGNAGAIGDLLNGNNPVDDTPTAESVTSVAATFPSDGDRPRVLVLATDGNPDTCANPDSNDQQAPKTGSENAVKAAYDNDMITTYVLGVGNDATQSHLQRLANLGQGMDAATGTATAYVANSPQDLVDAFGAIIGGVRSCDITINGTVDLSKADQGTVTFNGMDLTYGTDWTLTGPSTLELIGQTCDDYLSATMVDLTAHWPCGSVVVD